MISGTPDAATNASFTVQVVGGILSSTGVFSLTIYPAEPTITTASPLPAGVAGTAYSQTLAASGSPTPYVWSLAGGNLPSGLTLSTNGSISGTPSLAVAASFTVQVMGANGLSTNKVFGLTINPTITTTSPLPAGVLGTAYNLTLAASGGTAPYVWIITAGNLPAGLNLSSAGALTGIPTVAVNASFTVQVADNNGLSATKPLNLTVTGPLTITTASPLPAGVAGIAYSRTLAANGSTAPYVWSLATGSLPAGLSLSTNGLISGTPSLAVAANFTVQVMGANGLFTNKVFGLTINPAITSVSPLPTGGVGATYNLTLAASGGTAPYVWIITAGALPSGLNLSSAGALTGTPTMVTNASFTVRVTDNNGLSTTKPLNLTVTGPPTITTASPLPAGVPGMVYSQTLAASGSTPPYVWSITAGSLPSGLTLSANGLISGTPNSATNASFSVQVVGNNGLSATTVFDLSTLSLLPAALDQPDWVIVTGGSQPWFSQTTNTHDGVDAARSGRLTPFQESWMQTSLTGPGELTYWRKVSSGFGVFLLEFYLDGVLQSGRISGTVDWQKQTNSIPAGSHTVKWRSVNDYFFSSEVDVGWVDEVTFVPGTPPRPTIIVKDGAFGFGMNGFGFNLSGVAGQTVVVEGSSNLLDWLPLQTNTFGSSPLYFSDPGSTGSSVRFYRARLWP